jgi:succinate dehydrogenase/fumarate reductase flavoprotein subunit
MNLCQRHLRVWTDSGSGLTRRKSLVRRWRPWYISAPISPYRGERITKSCSATGGTTFTVGGLKIKTNAQVIGTDWRQIPGLFACGDMVGSLFYFHDPGDASQASGAAFGRSAAHA